jgi:alkaline phosphatase
MGGRAGRGLGLALLIAVAGCGADGAKVGGRDGAAVEAGAPAGSGGAAAPDADTTSGGAMPDGTATDAAVLDDGGTPGGGAPDGGAPAVGAMPDAGPAPGGAMDADAPPGGTRDADAPPGEMRDAETPPGGTRDADAPPGGTRDADAPPGGPQDADRPPDGALPDGGARADAGGVADAGAVSDAGGPPSPGPEVIILAAGDVACAGCAQQETAALLSRLSSGGRAAAILPLGDLGYENGSLSELTASYAPAWGLPELLAISRPVPGNHEYVQPGAPGYFDYFNGVGAATGRAGARGEGYYSFDVGAWHVVALNSSNGCYDVRCDVGSPQQAWLAADLAAHPARCTLAYWHMPRFQGGYMERETPAVGPLWDTFADAGGDVILNGHEHNYQQLVPLDKHGSADAARGIRSFVVGTGGAGFHDAFGGPHEWAVEKRVIDRHGVLELTLLDGGYRWRFVAVDGSVPAGASGAASCH